MPYLFILYRSLLEAKALKLPDIASFFLKAQCFSHPLSVCGIFTVDDEVASVRNGHLVYLTLESLARA